jgi:putative enhanced entry protein enhC
MEIFKNFLILLVLLISILSCKQYPKRNEKIADSISTGSTYWISDEEIHTLEEKASHGDKNSSFKLYQYHMFVSLNQNLEFKWLEIAAKNGHPIAQSNLADLSLAQGNKEKATFWAKKAYENGAKLPDELKILIK